MLVAAAYCPHPPLLVPAVASGASDELDDLRKAADEAVSRIVRTGPALILLLGAGELTRALGNDTRGSLAGFGLETELDGDPDFPLSLTIGRWLLDRAQWGGAVLAHSITHGLPPAACADLGWRLTTGPKRVAILAMGDGAFSRGEKAPGYLDPEAETYDRSVTASLKHGDYETLADLSPETAERLNATGRTPLQALAGAAAGGRWSGEILYDRAPYGVGYTVAYWERAGTSTNAPYAEVAPEQTTPEPEPAPTPEPEAPKEPPIIVFDAQAGRLIEHPATPADPDIEPDLSDDEGSQDPQTDQDSGPKTYVFGAESADSGEGTSDAVSKIDLEQELP